MSKNNTNYLKQLYRFDDSDKTYMIDISLDSYEEIFNDWDAAPLRKKAMNPELESFLEETAYELSLKNKVKVVFVVPESIRNEQKEALVVEGFKNYYFSLNHFINRDMRTNYRKILTYLGLGFIFIIISYLYTFADNPNFFLEILSQGIFVGGWVLFWEAFSLFFFDMYEIRDKKKRYSRFIKCKKVFRYIEK